MKPNKRTIKYLGGAGGNLIYVTLVTVIWLTDESVRTKLVCIEPLAARFGRASTNAHKSANGPEVIGKSLEFGV